MFQFAAALAMSPYTRVNSKCWPVWNTAMNEIHFVWNGETYSNPFDARTYTLGNGQLFGRFSDYDFMRLFCMNSGAAGSVDYGGVNASWLGHKDQVYRVSQRRDMRRHFGFMLSGSRITTTVVDSTLYYYYNDMTSSANPPLPLLNSIVFKPWSPGVNSSELVTQVLKDFPVFLSNEPYRYGRHISLLYPSGINSVTVSIGDKFVNENGKRANSAVDAVVSTSDQAWTSAMVHYYRDEITSVASQTREVATFPGYTCRATLKSTIVCAEILDGGQYTWASNPHVEKTYHWSFVPLSRRFQLPAQVWLLGAMAATRQPFAAVVNSGHTPVFGVADRVLSAVEPRPDASCASGYRLFLVRRALPDGAELGNDALNCEWKQTIRVYSHTESTHAASTVKWAGPWTDGPLFTAISLNSSKYHARGESEDPWMGDPSREHYSIGARSGVVMMDFAGERLLCPAANRGGSPTNITLAAGAVQQGRVDCLQRLVPSRVPASTYHRGCPLLGYAQVTAVAAELIAAGADVNAKCTNRKTPILRQLAHPDVVRILIHAGAAVCTWPVGPLTMRESVPDNLFMYNYMNQMNFDANQMFVIDYQEKQGYKVMLAAGPTSPCEPGYHIVDGEGCDGLRVCPEGHFCPGYKQRTNKAIPCPAGTYGPLSGTVSLTQCRPCPVERPFSAPGATNLGECLQNAINGSAQDSTAEAVKGSVQS